MRLSICRLDCEGIEGYVAGERPRCRARGQLLVVLEVVGEGFLVVGVEMFDNSVFRCRIFGRLICHCGGVEGREEGGRRSVESWQDRDTILLLLEGELLVKRVSGRGAGT